MGRSDTSGRIALGRSARLCPRTGAAREERVRGQRAQIREPAHHRIPQGFAQARDFTRRTLGRWALGDRGDDAALVVTELATNAVLHAVARPGADQTGVWLKLTLRRAHLVCAVTDQSDSPPVCPRTDGALEVHGRGLRIVEALSEHWGWTLSPAGKTVWAMLPALPRPTPSAWHGLT
ncbi:ATP-binding protein [Streptomyces kaempferi]